MRGMTTITSGPQPKIELNAEFIALAQTSKYVQPNAVRIDSSNPKVDGISNVAFQNPDGSKVLVIRNDSDKPQSIDTQIEGCSMGVTSVPAGGAVTLKWP
jgi:glucosylceramidase